MLEVDIEQEEDGEEKERLGSQGSIQLGSLEVRCCSLPRERYFEEKVIEVVEAALAAAYKKDWKARASDSRGIRQGDENRRNLS